MDRRILNILQSQFPLVVRPFEAIGKMLGASEGEVLTRVRRLKAEGVIRQISGIFDSRMLGYRSSLVAMSFTRDRLDEGALAINRHPGVSHNYARNHAFNLWFTLTIPQHRSLENEVEKLAEAAKPERTLILPTVRLFKIGVNLDMTGDATAEQQEAPGYRWKSGPTPLTAFEVALVRELQEDIAAQPRPFAEMASRLGLSEEELLGHAERFIERGVMRRYAAVLRHRQAGYVANAMGVWVVPEDAVERVGPVMASFRAVSHCYQRPAYPPEWPYNLYTMVHSMNPQRCREILKAISEKTGITDYKALFSIKEYKKERVKYFVEYES